MRSEGYCSWVCLSVCLLSHISPMERLFVLKTLSRAQQATKVKKFVGFSLKPLRCRDPALPPLYGHAYSRPFFHAYFSCTRMHISRVYTPMIHRRGFSTFHYTCSCLPPLLLPLLSRREKTTRGHMTSHVTCQMVCMMRQTILMRSHMTSHVMSTQSHLSEVEPHPPITSHTMTQTVQVIIT